MHFDPHLGKLKNGYRNVALGGRFKTLIDAKVGRYRSRDATVAELKAMDRKLRPGIPGLANSEVLLQLQAHNPSIFQIVENASTWHMTGFNAQLPLTTKGFEALTSGRFSTARPLTEHVAGKGEQVGAIYVWLTYSPRSFIANVAGMSDYVRRCAPRGCALFCTPASEKAAALLAKCGYEPASYNFPAAPRRLLVAYPIANNIRNPKHTDPASRDAIEISVVRTLHEWTQVIAVRAATYMHEQECPFDEEFDGNDFCATHLVGRIDGEPAGCIRVRYFADFVKFERLAVRHEFRNSRLSFRLVREAMRFAAQKGYGRVYGHARHDLVKFWMTFGFRPIPDRPPFIFSDVEYVEMEGPISLHVNRVAVGDNPLRIIRPEGLWDKPGVLERKTNVARMGRIGTRLIRPQSIREGRRKAC